MLSELRFVGGAVAKKEFIPAHKHFSIDKGTIRAYNGHLALSSPIAFDIDCKPHAAQLIQAINNCSPDHTITMSMTDGGRLRIVNGPYKAFVDCLQEETPHVEPAGDLIPIDGATLRKALECVEPFIGKDASRTWTNGVLLSGGSALATCNVIVVEYWLGGVQLPFTVNVPRDAIREVLRVDEDPSHVQIHENSITFRYPSDRWIRTQLWEEWKVVDHVRKILAEPNNPLPIGDEFFKALDTVKPFLNKQNEIFFRDGGLHSSLYEEGAESSASYQLNNFPYEGCYSAPMVKLLDGVVEKIDWTGYPNPCLFYGAGGMLRGAIIGRKMVTDVKQG